jgi:hypothetical protein
VVSTVASVSLPMSMSRRYGEGVRSTSAGLPNRAA